MQQAELQKDNSLEALTEKNVEELYAGLRSLGWTGTVAGKDGNGEEDGHGEN